MTVLLYVMYAVEVVVAILLMAVILIQRSKSGGGLGGLATTSAGVEEAFGSSAGNVLIKATVTLGLIFVLNTTGITVCQGIMGVRQNEDALGNSIEQVEKSAPAAPATDAKATDAKAPAANKATDAKVPPAPANDAPAAVTKPAAGTEKKK